MQVEVVHFLAGFFADADQKPVTGHGEFCSNFFRDGKHPAGNPFVPVLKIVDGGDMFFRYDQEVCFGPGIDIGKGQTVIILIFDFGGYLLGGDFAKDAIFIHKLYFKKDPNMLLEAF